MLNAGNQDTVQKTGAQPNSAARILPRRWRGNQNSERRMGRRSHVPVRGHGLSRGSEVEHSRFREKLVLRKRKSKK